MRNDTWLMRLYLVDVALLLVHEMDSAFWREWDLFGLPGGEELFLLIHIPLVIALVWAYHELAEGRPWGYRVAGLTALTGIIALGIHATFLLRGAPEFATPLSVGIILAMAFVSAALGVLVAPRLAPA